MATYFPKHLLFLFCFEFTSLKDRVERDQDNHLLVHKPTGYNMQEQARHKAGTTSRLSMWVAGSKCLSLQLQLSRCTSSKLDQELQQVSLEPSIQKWVAGLLSCGSTHCAEILASQIFALLKNMCRGWLCGAADGALLAILGFPHTSASLNPAAFPPSILPKELGKQQMRAQVLWSLPPICRRHEWSS